MPALLAYHDDARIGSVELAVGLPLAVLVVVVCLVLWTRAPVRRGDGVARVVLLVALAQLPIAYLGQTLYALVLFPAWLALVVVATLLALRRPGRLAVAALAVSGLTASYLAASAIACVVTDACFH